MFDGTFDSLVNKPITLEGYGITDSSHGRWNELTNTPTTLLGYGITDAVGPMHVTYSINQDNIENWNNAYHYSIIDQSQFFKDINWLPTWSDVLDKPDFSTLGGGGGGGGGTSIHGLLTGLDYSSSGHTGFVSSATYTAVDVFAKVLTQDGTGTGLDADLLDGQQGYWYAPINNPTFTGNINFPGSGIWNSSGNVGIGIAPSFKTHISLSSAVDETILFLGETIGTGWADRIGKLLNLTWGGTNYPMAAIGAEYNSTTGSGDIVFNSMYNGGIKTYSDRVMTIKGNGNVLINQTTGSEKLCITGNIKVTGNCEITGSSLFNGLVKTNGGVHIGGSSDPGAGNLIVHGTTSPSILNYGGLVKSNYVSQLTGYRISNAGEADFRYLYADQLHVKSFIADLEQALAGGQIISKSVAKVAADFTIPVAGASGNLVVEEFASSPGYVFVDYDMIRLRQFSRSGNTTLDVSDVWGTVVHASRDIYANPTTQTFTFTRSSGINAGTATAGTIIKTGTLALDYGVSGNGYYEVTAVDGANGVNSPYAQFVTWTTHPAIPTTGLTIKTRIGNLAGITDAAFPTIGGYGLYADNVYLKGQIVISSGSTGYSNITDKPTLGSLAAKSSVDLNTGDVTNKSLANLDGTANTKLGTIESGANVTSTHTAAGIAGQGALATLNSVDFATQVGGATKPANNATLGATWGTDMIPPAYLTTPGASANLYIDGNKIGYWNGSAWKTYIDKDGNLVLGDSGLTGAGLFWNQSAASLSLKGAIYATSGSFTGSIYAGSGDIGGFTITANELYAGSGATRVEMQATGGFWAGADTFAAAQFSVSPAGTLTAKGVAEIGTATVNIGGYSSNVAIKGPDIWENKYAADSSRLYINRLGYDGTNSYFRDFVVCNGKGAAILWVGGANGITSSANAFVCNSTFTANSTSTFNGNTQCVGDLTFSTGAKTFTVPRMTNSQKLGMTQVGGMIVFITDLGQFHKSDGTSWYLM